MNELFPTVSPKKKTFVGSILKNIPNPEEKQKRMNEQVSELRLTRAYWRQKSEFRYNFNVSSDERKQRKAGYLGKINNKINLEESLKDININEPRSLLMSTSGLLQSKYTCKERES